MQSLSSSFLPVVISGAGDDVGDDAARVTV
jgi:hypothetical protein